MRPNQRASDITPHQKGMSMHLKIPTKKSNRVGRAGAYEEDAEADTQDKTREELVRR